MGDEAFGTCFGMSVTLPSTHPADRAYAFAKCRAYRALLAHWLWAGITLADSGKPCFGFRRVVTHPAAGGEKNDPKRGAREIWPLKKPPGGADGIRLVSAGSP
jgi:hypothetical protein